MSHTQRRTAQVAMQPAVHSSRRVRQPRSPKNDLARSFEIDVTTPIPGVDASVWMDARIDLIANLEEKYPGDPGQLSGGHLRFSGCGTDAALMVYFGSHCLGYAEGNELQGFLAAGMQAFMCGLQSGQQDQITVRLGEAYPRWHSGRLSGEEIVLTSGQNPTVEVCSGAHCFGILTGAAVGEFLGRAVARTGKPARKAEVIDFRAAALRVREAAGGQSMAGPWHAA